VPIHNSVPPSLLPMPATVPLPIWVLKKGMPVRRMKSVNRPSSRGRFVAAPNITSGRFACISITAARSTAASCATGNSTGCTGTMPMLSSTCSPATSSGSSRCTGPGRSSAATRKASRTTVGMLAALTICREAFVSGFIVATMSTI